MSDDTRRLILARRARFVAAALASVAATTTSIGAATEGCGGDTEQQDGGTSSGEPKPCLFVAPPDSGGDANPQPCLVPEQCPEEDAGVDANGKDADAQAQPCLVAPLDGGT